jgi:lipopolysaccharide/colanic/teichoic acid biosynthesis glycosyltransferase
MKRALDVFGATVGLLALLPVLVVVAVLVRTDLGTPVLFRQRRAGRDERPFELVKFRTMRDAVDAAGVPLPDEVRLTRLGRWLRSSSLDELPELWNVLRGDMSLVGPRPLPMEYLPRYTTEERRRHEVRPGMTGWAQINGRNLVDWDDRLALDVWYVEHRSLLLDLRILWRTIAAVARRDGISAEGHATMQVLRPHLAEPEPES